MNDLRKLVQDVPGYELKGHKAVTTLSKVNDPDVAITLQIELDLDVNRQKPIKLSADGFEPQERFEYVMNAYDRVGDIKRECGLYDRDEIARALRQQD